MRGARAKESRQLVVCYARYLELAHIVRSSSVDVLGITANRLFTTSPTEHSPTVDPHWFVAHEIQPAMDHL